MRRLGTAALALGCCWWWAPPRAQEADPKPPEGPDLEFLEYLGSWAEDDEWLELEELRKRIRVGGGRTEDAETENGDEDEDE